MLILDNMGRQKAIAALEIYREHEKFRKQLENMEDIEGSSKPFEAAAATSTPAAVEEPVDDGFLQVKPQVTEPEEEKKEKHPPTEVVTD